MKIIKLLIIILAFSTNQLIAQNSKKGFEYSGSKVRISMLGKSRMFSEGVKPVDFTIYWNKKKNIVLVNSGPKEKWYSININQVDTIHGNVTHIGMLDSIEKNADDEQRKKATCEVRFLLDKITVKIGDARLEEFLLEGASVWDDNKVVTRN
jgi:accessory colonization factor AcfC